MIFESTIRNWVRKLELIYLKIRRHMTCGGLYNEMVMMFWNVNRVTCARTLVSTDGLIIRKLTLSIKNGVACFLELRKGALFSKLDIEDKWLVPLTEPCLKLYPKMSRRICDHSLVIAWPLECNLSREQVSCTNVSLRSKIRDPIPRDDIFMLGRRFAWVQPKCNLGAPHTPHLHHGSYL